MSRRQFLKASGVGAGALGMSAVLAACGGGDTGPGTSTGGAPTVDFSAEPNGQINFANWVAYIDKAKDANGDQYSPSLQQFQEETGIEVNYTENINSNNEFFAKIRPQLAAGDDPGYDIIVITNGREFTALTQNNWVYELDPALRPNFDAHAAAWAKDPAFDQGNKYSMPWQSGITGIAWNTELQSEPITTLDDLANPAKLPPSSVGMLKSDMPDFVMINLGIDPVTSGPAEWKEARDWLMKQRDAGVVRQYYEQDYLPDMQNGNLNANMAWSGDVLYSAVWLLLPLQFELPQGDTGGALLWIDNQMIPVGAQNPVDAYTLMDYVYDPKVAQGITEWVQYMSPVPEVQGLIAQHAEKVLAGKYKGYGNKLELTAESEFLWPSDEFLSRTSFARNLTTDEEIEEFDSIFLPVSQG